MLLLLSSVQRRPILLDMAAHLAFLLASLALAWTGPTLLEAIALCALVAALNMAWSLLTTPGLRALARGAIGRLIPGKSV